MPSAAFLAAYVWPLYGAEPNGEQLRALRKSLGVRSGALARQMSTDARYLRAVEAGDAALTEKYRRRFLDALERIYTARQLNAMTAQGGTNG